VTALDEEYESGLAAYIRTGAEEALAGAYELGRRAVIDGFGVLDMTALHRAAIERIVLRAPPVDQVRIAKAAAEYFNELMSPFEMSFRGYRTANEELRQLNRSLQQQKEAVEIANHELEAFTYSVSHDLRAPLRHIDGFAGLLRKSDGDRLSEKGRGYLAHISDSAKQMGTLIDDLLVFSRMGRSEMKMGPVNLQQLVGEIVQSLQRQEAKDRPIRWKIEGLPTVHGDQPMLRQVFVNLLSNAVKYSRPRDPAEIEVGCFDEEKEIVIFVRDNGVGFEMQYAQKLFGVFQRLHRAEEFEGTGIGLANVRRIVTRHLGRTWAESVPGAGATFYFSLPKNREQKP